MIPVSFLQPVILFQVKLLSVAGQPLEYVYRWRKGVPPAPAAAIPGLSRAIGKPGNDVARGIQVWPHSERNQSSSHCVTSELASDDYFVINMCLIGCIGAKGEMVAEFVLSPLLLFFSPTISTVCYSCCFLPPSVNLKLGIHIQFFVQTAG